MKPRCYKDRLQGHRDVILEIYSPYGSSIGTLYSISKDGISIIFRYLKGLGPFSTINTVKTYFIKNRLDFK